jgi:hypothetical protein
LAVCGSKAISAPAIRRVPVSRRGLRFAASDSAIGLERRLARRIDAFSILSTELTDIGLQATDQILELSLGAPCVEAPSHLAGYRSSSTGLDLSERPLVQIVRERDADLLHHGTLLARVSDQV